MSSSRRICCPSSPRRGNARRQQQQQQQVQAVAAQEQAAAAADGRHRPRTHQRCARRASDCCLAPVNEVLRGPRVELPGVDLPGVRAELQRREVARELEQAKARLNQQNLTPDARARQLEILEMQALVKALKRAKEGEPSAEPATVTMPEEAAPEVAAPEVGTRQVEGGYPSSPVKRACRPAPQDCANGQRFLTRGPVRPSTLEREWRSLRALPLPT